MNIHNNDRMPKEDGYPFIASMTDIRVCAGAAT